MFRQRPRARIHAQTPVFFTFLSLFKQVFGRGLDGTLTAIIFANTRLHAQTWVFLTKSMFKFALHDVKLLRQNGQWGGKEGGGYNVYLNRNLHT